MRNYSLRVVIGSTDEVRVKKYLEKKGITYSEDLGVFSSNYLKFRANKKTWKKIKKDLDLVINSVYCSCNTKESEA